MSKRSRRSRRTSNSQIRWWIISRTILVWASTWSEADFALKVDWYMLCSISTLPSCCLRLLRRKTFRLPYYESWVGTYSFPCDTQQGEFDSFVYDVTFLDWSWDSFLKYIITSLLSSFFLVWHSILVLQFICWHHFLTGWRLMIWPVDSLLMKHWNSFKMSILN